MAEQLKYIYNEAYIAKLVEAIQLNYSTFNSDTFTTSIFNSEWETLELKQRMHHITFCLHKTLTADYQTDIHILQKTITQLQGHGLANMIFPNYVEHYGLEEWDISLEALELFTQYGSSEFAVRPFIIRDGRRMMQQMLIWSQHDNPHVRRLSSEGCRPRLPWAIALPSFKQDPSSILPILENLKADPSEYVRKSVANNLNDISKDHPDWVLHIAQQWYGNNPNTNWVIKHGCRTLLKKGNPRALALFGFEQNTSAEIENLQISSTRLAIGDEFIFSFLLVTNQTGLSKLRLEYAIDYVKANHLTSRKIFQITEKRFEPSTRVTIKRRHSFREMTTRKHYPGIHRLTILVNGLEQATMEFKLE